MSKQKPGWYARVIIIFCGLFLILGYAYFQTIRTLQGASLAIVTPLSGALLSNPLLGVAGVARNAASISINGREIYTDEMGRFAEELLLAEGINTITVQAHDRFGSVREETREVIYRPIKTRAADHEARWNDGQTNL